MHFFRLAVLLLIFCALPLWAKLGDTVPECTKRYGVPGGFTEANGKSPFGTLAFRAGKYTLLVFLLDVKEVGARVTKTDKSAFTEDEMKTIMDAEGDPASPWTPTSSTDPTCLEWTRGDKATVLYDKDKHVLIITSPAMADAVRTFVPKPTPAATPATNSASPAAPAKPAQN